MQISTYEKQFIFSERWECKHFSLFTHGLLFSSSHLDLHVALGNSPTQRLSSPQSKYRHANSERVWGFKPLRSNDPSTKNPAVKIGWETLENSTTTYGEHSQAHQRVIDTLVILHIRHFRSTLINKLTRLTVLKTALDFKSTATNTLKKARPLINQKSCIRRM